MLKHLFISRLLPCCLALSVLLTWPIRLKAQDETQQLISQKDSYTYVLCYYDQAIKFAVANLESDDPSTKKFAEEIASKVIMLRLCGQIPDAELKLLSIFARTTKDYYMRFQIAMAQIKLGGEEGASIVIGEFRDKKLPYDSRVRALEALVKRDIKPFEKAFECALEDKDEVAALGAKGLYQLGNPKGKEWFLWRIDRKNHLGRPGHTILSAIAGMRITEAIPSLKDWLSYVNPTYTEAELRARQTEIAITLAKISAEEGTEFLRRMLSEPEKNPFGTTGQAAMFLARIGDVDSIPLMEHALGTKVKRDKLRVAEALLVLKSQKPVPMLLQYLDREDGWAFESAKLLIKYRVKEAVPALEMLFEKELEMRESLRKQLEEEPRMQEWIKQGNGSLEDYVTEFYKDRFWMCVRLAVGLFELGSRKGRRSVIVLLRDLHEASRDENSWKLLSQTVVEHKITGAIPYVLPYLDSNDPLRRRWALHCLRGLTGSNLPPKRERWEIWYENHKDKETERNCPDSPDSKSPQGFVR